MKIFPQPPESVLAHKNIKYPLYGNSSPWCCVCVCVCACVCVCVRTCVHSVCMHACVRVCVLCMCVCCACVCARVLICACVCIYSAKMSTLMKIRFYYGMRMGLTADNRSNLHLTHISLQLPLCMHYVNMFL